MEQTKTILPAWTDNNLIYEIYPLGFFSCPKINPIAKISPSIREIKPQHRLASIREYYPYFKELDIDTIYFGPIFESCTHGYDTINYFQIDRRLGTNELFKEIITELHQLKIKVILDGIFNHTSRLFPAFVDIKNKLKQSPFQQWYKNINFADNNIWQDNFSYTFWKDQVELPKLNLDNQDVRKYIYQITYHWLKQYSIDGWRLDVAYEISPQFWQEFSKVCRDVNPNCLLIGEIIEQNLNLWVNNKTLHTASNYQLYSNMIDAFNQNNFWLLKEEFARQDKIYSTIKPIIFTGNHDTSRLITSIKQPKNYFSLLSLILTNPNLLQIYYGDELGLWGERNIGNDHELRKSMPNVNNLNQIQKTYLDQTKKLIKIRKKFNLQNTSLQILHVDHQLFIYHLSGKILVIINTFSQKKLIKIQLPTFIQSIKNELSNMQTTININNNLLSLTIDPSTPQIFSINCQHYL